MTVFYQEVQILLKKLIPLLFVIVQSLPLAALSNEKSIKMAECCRG